LARDGQTVLISGLSLGRRWGGLLSWASARSGPRTVTPTTVPTAHMTPSIRLLGEHPATIDGEGRIQLPLALRDEWNLHKPDFALMASLEPDGSLCLRTREDWDHHSEDLRRSPRPSARARQSLLLFAAYSSSVRCDKSGRVRVPDALLELVGIDRKAEDRREVVLVGNFEDVRLWSKEGWQAFRDAAREEFAAGIEELIEGRSLGPEGLVDRESA
jgi:division/cell wall cluster transcriptional repressor MraZ